MFLFQGWFTPLGLMFLYLKESMFWFLISVGKIIYIDNRNIRSDSLYKDGLHLIDKGKAFLADNFIVYLNNNTFLETHTHPLNDFWEMTLDKQMSFFKWEQNYICYERMGTISKQSFDRLLELYVTKQHIFKYLHGTYL